VCLRVFLCSSLEVTLGVSLVSLYSSLDVNLGVSLCTSLEVTLGVSSGVFMFKSGGDFRYFFRCLYIQAWR